MQRTVILLDPRQQPGDGRPQAMLTMALGNRRHLVWADGKAEPPDLRTLQEAFPEYEIRERPSRRPGRPAKRQSQPLPEPEEEDIYFVFWDGDTQLELDEDQVQLVREAIAERLALQMLRGLPAIAQLELFHYKINWQEVLGSGIEIVKVGEEPKGNRYGIPPVTSPTD